MHSDIITSIEKATSLPKDLISRVFVRSKELKHGDFAFPCFPLAKEWKLSPPECAAKLATILALPDSVDRVEVVGPYLNFFLKRSNQVKEVLGKALSEGENVGKRSPRNETVVVEYSSPNIAKPFGVHHLRTTLIGLSLDRIYKFLGYKVVSINHIGDWGTQFGFVWAGCELWGKPKEESVGALVELYVKASSLKKAQDEKNVAKDDLNKPDINELARGYFIKLEAGDKEATAFWKWCLDISLKYFKESYTRLGISFDYYHGESFYRDKIANVEEMLRKSGTLEESRGALGVDLGKKLGFVRIFAEDGRSLYVTRDLACAIYRYDTFSPFKILYVVAMQQSLYFQQLIEVLRKVKHPVAEKMVHVSFGYVPGMKTREGGAIALNDFLNEAHERALKSYREEVERRPADIDEDEIAEKVAIGATYFYFLSHSNAKDFNFRWEEALNFSGDSGPYAQYALARLNSIEAKAKESGIILSADNKFNPSLLEDDDSYYIVSLLSRFDEVVDEAAHSYEPHHIAIYLLDLAKAFSSVYKKLRVVGEEKELAKARLSLFMAVRNVLQAGLQLIGVPAVERM